MNLIDVILLLLVFLFLAIGFFQGTIKLVVLIIAFYISIVLSGLYFQILGRFFQQKLHTAADIGQIVAFVTILLVGFLLLAMAGLYTFRYAKLPLTLDFVDKLVGTILGLLMGGLFVGMFAQMLVLFFIDRSPAATLNWPIMQSTQAAVRVSVLVNIFTDSILPLIIGIVRPFLPSESLFIFRLN